MAQEKDCCRHSWHGKKERPVSSSHIASLSCRLLLSLGLICCPLHGATAHPLEDRVYSDVAKSFDSQIIHLPDLQTVIDIVAMRVHCSSLDRNTSTCVGYNCMKADSVFDQAGYIPGTEILTPKTFAGVSVPILAQLQNFQKYCGPESSNHGPLPCSSPSSVQERLGCWSGQLLGNSSSVLTESDLDRVLAKLSLTYRPTTKEQNAQKKILTASSILADYLQIPKGSTIQTQDIPAVSSLIVSHLFNGLPIGASGKHQHDQVNPDILNISSLTPNLFIALLFDVDTETGFALSDERLHNITKKLNIGTTIDHDHGHHRETRSIAAYHQEEQSRPFNRTCWSLDTILAAYGVQEKKPLSQDEFEKLCPALIQQTFYDACEPSLLEVALEALPAITDAEKYGYGTAAVVTICALSLLGIVFIPLFKRRFYENALQGFIALGVGTLSGDALLHLLPEALEAHKHEANRGGKDQEEVKDLTGLWRAVACLGAVYGFYVWETALHSLISHRNKRRHAHGDSHSHHHHGEGGHHDHSHIPDPEAFKAAMAHPKKAVEVCGGSEMVMKDSDSDGKTTEVVVQKQPDSICGMTPLASMLLLSGCLHNFADGLTIAAAFSVDLNSGISTSIAIFCHEVPHELGDFAVLLGSGMSFKRAMVLHGLTEAFSLVGFYIGIPISENESARQWIFAVAAGMFLYVALADMLPELKHGAKNITMVVVQNIGILFGFAIMITMAVFEDAIKI